MERGKEGEDGGRKTDFCESAYERHHEINQGAFLVRCDAWESVPLSPVFLPLVWSTLNLGVWESIADISLLFRRLTSLVGGVTNPRILPSGILRFPLIRPSASICHQLRPIETDSAPHK